MPVLNMECSHNSRVDAWAPFYSRSMILLGRFSAILIAPDFVVN